MSLSYGKDTGWRIFKQPNGVEFIGREFGDEFELNCITKNGYQYVRNSETKWMYYAILDTKGEFAASDSRVGIDAPPAAVSLTRSKQRLAEIHKQRIEYGESLTKQRIEYLNN